MAKKGRRVFEGGLGAGDGQGQGGHPAAPKPWPPSWLGCGLCWPYFGGKSPASFSGGALERESMVLRAADAHLYRVRRTPSRQQRQIVGGELRLRFAKTWPTRAPSKQGWSASPRISGPMWVFSGSDGRGCLSPLVACNAEISSLWWANVDNPSLQGSRSGAGVCF
ncbi:UNVERIFIED_CONTAM: hypothetical protein Sindi_1796300 [Sesamum indicum]